MTDTDGVLLDTQTHGTTTELAPYFTLERVSSAESLLQEWEPVFVEVFPDVNDREPPQELLKRLANGEDFFLMRDIKGKPVGIELAQARHGNGAMYIPWTGVLREYRNFGIGSMMTRRISKYMKQKYNITHTILDIEDPARLHTSGYPEDEMEEAKEMAARRINFWRRKGFIVIDDMYKKSGEKLEYVRPSSENDQDIQAYDHMIIRFEDETMHENLNVLEGSIRKSFVRECYLQMTRIQYGNFSEKELRAAYPAVEKYLSDIDAIERDFLPFMTTPVRPKLTPVIPAQIRMLSDEQQGIGV